METALIVLLLIMIAGSVYSLFANDLLSAIVAFGIVGFGLVIAFLLLQAPDLAIVQVVVETISLVIMISVLILSSREDLKEKSLIRMNGSSYVYLRPILYNTAAVIIAGMLLYFFIQSIQQLEPFGEHTVRMANAYTESGIHDTGSVNLVTGIVFDYRGYDTLGEATILFTAVIGILMILRLVSKKQMV